MKHTDTPWRLITVGETPMHFIRGKGDLMVGKMNIEANAAFIVKAVNNHYWLLDELTAITAYAEHALKQFKDGNGSLDITLFNSLSKSAREAIKEAEL